MEGTDLLDGDTDTPLHNGKFLLGSPRSTVTEEEKNETPTENFMEIDHKRTEFERTGGVAGSSLDGKRSRVCVRAQKCLCPKQFP